VTPDIVAIAKGIVSAYLPIAATVVKNDVFKSFVGEPSEMRQVFQISTYGGHPVAAAVANRNVEIIVEEKLADRAAENGAYFLEALRTLTEHPWVGDVRGKGLLLGVELVKDKQTKEIVPPDTMKFVVDFARKNGVLVGRSGGGRHLGNTIQLSPPLVFTRPEIDRVVTVLDKAIAEAGTRLGAS
jgi:adenosylmethionine-8-amino-7-oxononanoate aminotransferase